MGSIRLVWVMLLRPGPSNIGTPDPSFVRPSRTFIFISATTSPTEV